MIKRVLFIGVGFLGFHFSLAAQHTSQTEEPGNHTATRESWRDIAMFDPTFALSLYRTGIPAGVDSYVLLPDRPELTLLASDDLLTEMGITPLDLFPVASSDVSVEQKATATPIHRPARKNSGTDGKDSPVEIVSPQWNRIYYGGEMGVFYGRWSGKYSGDIMETYLRGDLGNEKFHLSVGAAYGESNVNFSGFRSSPHSK
jgi:hypothetical protein